VITTDGALAGFLARLRDAPWVAMDTEADSLHSYPEKLCLVQLSIPGEDRLVDPLAGFSLQPLWQEMAGREILLHGGDYDLRLLHRGQAFTPASVFDTMFAARLLGIAEFGLNSLVRRFLGVELEKGAQRADWSQRPLTPRMIAYARNDSHYLDPLAQLLRQQLAEKGRLGWHAEMCRQLIADATEPLEDSSDEAWRIKSADHLSRRGMMFLRELWRWREREAVQGNRPPFFVLSHDTLFDIAVAAANGGEVAPLIPRRYSPRRRASLLTALERAATIPESEWPVARSRRGERLSLSQKHELDRLRGRRDRTATALGIDPTLIASRGMLVRLAADWEKHAPALLPWQRGLLQS
jgi:ribonuclease D